jgi:hypothetical protein
VLDPPGLKKKGRKRPKKKDYVSCQTTRVMDKISTQERQYHVAGEPMVSWEKYLMLPGDMKSLHDLILEEERRLLHMASPTYPFFVVKVPNGLDFVDKHLADVFFLRFEDIFSMFQMNRLHQNFVRLFTPAEAYQVRKEQELSPTLAIADPYYLYESYLVTYENRLSVMHYIESLFLANKDKKCFSFLIFPSKSLAGATRCFRIYFFHSV